MKSAKIKGLSATLCILLLTGFFSVFNAYADTSSVYASETITAVANSEVGVEFFDEQSSSNVVSNTSPTSDEYSNTETNKPNDSELVTTSSSEVAFIDNYSEVVVERSIPENATTFGLNSDLAPGDLIYFGTYEQDGDETNGVEAILWRVISNSNNEVLLLSEYGLDRTYFHRAPKYTYWEYSDVRAWLNNFFYNTAFSSSDKNIIKKSRVPIGMDSAFPNVWQGDSVTYDYVYILSRLEVFDTLFFADDAARTLEITPYAASKEDGQSNWLTRTVGGRFGETIVYIDENGNYKQHLDRKSDIFVIRPLITLDVTPKTYSVNITTNPSTGGTATESAICIENTNLTVKAYPNDGYTFVNWTENGIELSQSTNYSFILTEDRNLVANFEKTTPAPIPPSSLPPTPPSPSTAPPSPSTAPPSPSTAPPIAPSSPNTSPISSTPTSSTILPTSSIVSSTPTSTSSSSTTVTSESAPPSSIVVAASAASSSRDATQPSVEALTPKVQRSRTLQEIEDSGVPVLSFGNTEVPLAAPSKLFIWSIFNLLIALTSVMLCFFVGYKIYRNKQENNVISPLHIVSIVSGILTLILFFATANLAGIMVIFDTWSIVFLVLLAVEVVSLIIFEKKYKVLKIK